MAETDKIKTMTCSSSSSTIMIILAMAIITVFPLITTTHSKGFDTKSCCGKCINTSYECLRRCHTEDSCDECRSGLQTCERECPCDYNTPPPPATPSCCEECDVVRDACAQFCLDEYSDKNACYARDCSAPRAECRKNCNAGGGECPDPDIECCEECHERSCVKECRTNCGFSTDNHR